MDLRQGPSCSSRCSTWSAGRRFSRACGVYVQIWAFVLSAGLVASSGTESSGIRPCPDQMSLMLEAELCLQPMSQHSNATTLTGGLTQHEWHVSCQLYNDSLRCIEALVRDCKYSDPNGDGLDVGESIVSALRSGMGKLCQDSDTLKRYLKHAACYSRQEGASVRCMNQFSDEVSYVGMQSQGDIQESTQKMCRSFHRLISCVNAAISTNCGSDAADLFDDLVEAQVPSQVTALCYDVMLRDATSAAVTWAARDLLGIISLAVGCALLLLDTNGYRMRPAL